MHWPPVIWGVVLLCMVMASPVFADEKETEELENLEIDVVYTDEGYVVYFAPQDRIFYSPPPRDFEPEDSATINTIFSERKFLKFIAIIEADLRFNAFNSLL